MHGVDDSGRVGGRWGARGVEVVYRGLPTLERVDCQCM